jgi:hypothetical protein
MADIQRVDDEFAADRCQAVMPTRGQCMNRVHPESEYCLAHGGNRAGQRAEKTRISNYRLSKYQARLERQVGNPSLKSLRDEIGLSRMIMEELINRCETNFDLLTNSQKISDMAMKIAVLVEKCHRLEGSMGQLLDKTTVLQIANTFINIIVEENLTEPQLDRIASKLMKAVGDHESS